MEIAFASKQLRELFNDENSALAKLGPDLGGLILRRVADLDAASRAHQLFFFPWISSITAEDGSDIILIDLDDTHQIVCEPQIPRNKTAETLNSRVDWTKVSRIKIIEIRSQDE